jgi:hydroxymethylbilane synthase
VRTFRVGTRKSALAMRQTEMVVAALRRARSAARFEVVQISTEGDERRDVSLQEIGGTGVFVKRIERALLADEIDLAVHSLKDVPTRLEPGLTLAGIPPRADPRDALVVAGAARPEPASPACALEELVRARLPELPYAARVGTGSARRAAQLRALRDDLTIGDVRGNVDTRLRKLDDGEFDALVLAAAGLARLDRLDRATRLLDPDEVVPMIGQGALAVESRADDQGALTTAAALDDWRTRVCVEAERAFLEALGGGCALPVGALALLEEVGEPTIHLRVALADAHGRRVERCEARANADEIGEVAIRLAAEALRAVEAA